MASPDYGATADALVTQYSVATLAALTPAGALAIRASQATTPNELSPLPFLLIRPDMATLVPSAGAQRKVSVAWFVRLFYQLRGDSDMERDSDQLLDWATVLQDRHLANISLAGNVYVTRTDSWRIGPMRYAGQQYSGMELKVGTVVTHGWTPTA